MPAFLLIFSLLFLTLSGCEDGRTQTRRNAKHGASDVRSGAKNLGRKTEKSFRHVGGHLERFFTGRETISR